MDFKSLDELYSYLENVAIPSALENEVAEGSISTMQNHVQNDVYNAYRPTQYERTGELLNSCEASLISNNTLEVKNTRQDDGKDIVEIIETGKGYFNQYVDDLIGERPFIENTYVELSSGKATMLMKQCLESKLGKGVVKVE